MNIHFTKEINSKNLIIGLAEDFNLNQDLNLEIKLIKIITEIIEQNKFTGKNGDSLNLAIPGEQILKFIMLIGLGKVEEFNHLSATKFGGKIISASKSSKLEEISALIDTRLLKQEDETCANIAYGCALRNYSFDKYKSAEKLVDKIILKSVSIITNEEKKSDEIFIKNLKPIAESVHFSRDLISEPPNVIYPESFCKAALKELESFDIKVEILSEEQMEKLGMNALVGVGQGSSRESKLLVMQYNGAHDDEAPVAFVGKGVTFDTGGISLKPANGMEDMKYDMSGAAIVTGLIRGLAARKAKVNIVAIAGLAENMPDGNAQRPSDVVRSMSGQTIEILNTDAEGRLVLADALWYCQDRFKPKLMIDLATLTGAIVVTLGKHFAGLFSNDNELEQALIASGKNTDEKLWPFPLNSDYDKMIDSTIADVRNTQNGKGAGSITAAQFLKRFVNNVSWAHLDIAGVSWADKDSELHPTGATAYGIRLLNDFIKSYEK